MKNRGKAKKILKIYAKEMMNSRMAFADAFLEKPLPAYKTISYKFMLKRCIMAIFILILSFALLVVVANGVGIKILNFSIFETPTHTELHNENQNPVEQYFEPTYIPEGYILVTIDDMGDMEREYIYSNNEDKALYIVESYSTGYASNINNENCEISIEQIGENETYIYQYTNGTSVFVLEKIDTYILVQSSLEKEEVIKIIEGLKAI